MMYDLDELADAMVAQMHEWGDEFSANNGERDMYFQGLLDALCDAGLLTSPRVKEKGKGKKVAPNVAALNAALVSLSITERSTGMKPPSLAERIHALDAADVKFAEFKEFKKLGPVIITYGEMLAYKYGYLDGSDKGWVKENIIEWEPDPEDDV